MKIHIFGASGSGVTTLGQALAGQLGCPYYDSDQYFWEKSDPPFTIRREPGYRNSLLMSDLSGSDDWILGGSIIQWGDQWPQLFDLVIFLLVPPEIRLARLRTRELQRYGDIILTDALRNKKFNDFITWASGYDDDTAKSNTGTSSRTLTAHRRWMEQLSCRLIEITGDTTLDERLQIVKQAIKTL